MTAEKWPEEWIWDVRGTMKTGRAGKLMLEVRPIDQGNYFRAELLLDDPEKRRWACGVWFHAPTEDEAVALVRSTAAWLGIVEV